MPRKQLTITKIAIEKSQREFCEAKNVVALYFSERDVRGRLFATEGSASFYNEFLDFLKVQKDDLKIEIHLIRITRLELYSDTLALAEIVVKLKEKFYSPILEIFHPPVTTTLPRKLEEMFVPATQRREI